MKSLHFFCIGIFLLTISAQAITIDERKTDIYFGNGVWNDRTQAENGQLELQVFIISEGVAKEGTEVKLAFNHTNGHRRDLIETFYQLAQQGQISFGYFQVLAKMMTPEIPDILRSIYLKGMVSEEASDVETMVKHYQQGIKGDRLL